MEQLDFERGVCIPFRKYSPQYSRGHSSAAAVHYSGPAAFNMLVSSGSSKISLHNAFESRGVYSSTVPDSPKFGEGEYVPSSGRGYPHKSDTLYAEKISDYPSVDHRQYGEWQSAYLGRDLSSETAAAYADVGLSHQHQALLVRQEQLLKSRTLQSASIDGGARQIDYLVARGVASRPAP